MSSDPDVLQTLGSIDGKLDQVIKAVDRHIDDDVRRFTEIHKKLDDQAEDINQAKGAKGALLWVAGGIAALVGTLATAAAKALGWH